MLSKGSYDSLPVDMRMSYNINLSFSIPVNCLQSSLISTNSNCQLGVNRARDYEDHQEIRPNPSSFIEAIIFIGGCCGGGVRFIATDV
mmetsp:Transcript_8500/g.14364  ORF Transcript_8500/g.14364 Transcript_8500/m.14364 type:complete len:88 (+) Transcript_8500:550-813(+)